MKVKRLTQDDMARILGKGLVILGPKQQPAPQPQPPDYDPEEDDLELLRKTERMRRFRASILYRGPEVQTQPSCPSLRYKTKNSGFQSGADDDA